MSQALDVYEVKLSNLCICLQKYCVLYFCSTISHYRKIPRSKILKNSVSHSFESLYQNKLLFKFPIDICEIAILDSLATSSQSVSIVTAMDIFHFDCKLRLETLLLGEESLTNEFSR